MIAFSAAQEALIHDKILESFDKFVSGSSEEGFEMVMGVKERVVKRLVGKRRERSEIEEISEK